MTVSLERRLSLLLEYLRRNRVLLVFDNMEVLLEEGQGTGYMRPGYEGYARLLRRMAHNLPVPAISKGCMCGKCLAEPSNGLAVGNQPGSVVWRGFLPDGTHLASCGDDNAIQLWDLQSGEHLQTLRRDRLYERATRYQRGKGIDRSTKGDVARVGGD